MEKEITIDGLRLHYEDCGNPDGTPILMMHGWGCDHTTLASVRDTVADGLRVVNVDLPGHGKSDEPPTPWGVYEFASLMEKFVKALGIDSPILLGHSFGGRVGIVMASRNPVKKMLLVDAAGIKPKRTLKYHAKVYTFKAMKRLLPMLFGKKKGEKMIEAWRGKAGSADYRNSSPVMRAVMSRCVNQDLKCHMPDIKASTLLIWGENDTATPLSDAKTMERLIPDAGLVSFPGCGHYSFLDNPGGFRAVVREFLKKELASARK
ncbi:MAG: alpha/beta hydrolase [Muribaculaceae bacterium]|nr:alpha/beta hydrolase [Muribaculaceae bacterium]